MKADPCCWPSTGWAELLLGRRVCPSYAPPMDDDGTSLIPAETLALVGREQGEPVTADITATGAQRYAQAVGDLNPIYFDVDAARAAGYRDLVVPPTYVQYALVRGRPLEDIREDGLFAGKASAMRPPRSVANTKVSERLRTSGCVRRHCESSVEPQRPVPTTKTGGSGSAALIATRGAQCARP